MGAILWQVVHQKAKNSTSCTFPDARLTEDGSVACNSGDIVGSADCVAGEGLSLSLVLVWTERSCVGAGKSAGDVSVTVRGCVLAGAPFSVAGELAVWHADNIHAPATNNTASTFRYKFRFVRFMTLLFDFPSYEQIIPFKICRICYKNLKQASTH